MTAVNSANGVSADRAYGAKGFEMLKAPEGTPADKIWTVAKDDSIWAKAASHLEKNIGRKASGAEINAYVADIKKANPGLKGDNIFPKDQIVLPDVKKGWGAKPAAAQPPLDKKLTDITDEISARYDAMPKPERTKDGKSATQAAMSVADMQAAAKAIDKFNRLPQAEQQQLDQRDPVAAWRRDQLAKSPGVGPFIGKSPVELERVVITGKKATLSEADNKTLARLAEKPSLKPDEKIKLKNELVAIAKKMPKAFFEGTKLQLQMEQAIGVAGKKEVLKAARGD